MAILFAMTLKATAVLLVSWTITRLLVRSSAAIRHLVWTSSAVVILVLPIVIAFGPVWQIPVLSSPITPVSSQSEVQEFRAQGLPTPRAATFPVSAIAPGSEAKPLNVSRLLITAWLLGFAVGVVRIATGLVAASRISRQSRRSDDPEWIAILADAEASLSLGRHVPLLINDQISVPGVCGIVRQRLLLPVAAGQWDPQRRRLVLLHELAHVKRRDCLAQTIAQIACAVHWFNPFAFVAARRLRQEQERACDDLVLESGASGPEYAKHLLEIALAARPRQLWESATVAMARSSFIGDRVVAILDRNRSRRSPSSALRALVVAIACLGVLPFGSMRLAARIQPRIEPAVPIAPLVSEPVAPSATTATAPLLPAPEVKPDFTGTWKYESGDNSWPLGGYDTWVIKQTAIEITVDASSANTAPYHATYYFNRWGTKWDSDWTHQIGRAQWEGSKLVTAFGSEAGYVRNPWIFQLSPDGRSIRSEMVVMSGMGLSFDFKESSISQVYARQHNVYVKVAGN